MNDRLWAKDLTQEQFEREWARRNPGSDVVPDVRIWAGQNEPKYERLITGISPADVLADDADVKDDLRNLKEEPAEEPKQPDLEPKKKGAQKGSFKCRGCGREFEYKVARAGHERACKVALNMKG